MLPIVKLLVYDFVCDAYLVSTISCSHTIYFCLLSAVTVIVTVAVYLFAITVCFHTLATITEGRKKKSSLFRCILSMCSMLVLLPPPQPLLLLLLLRKRYYVFSIEMALLFVILLLLLLFISLLSSPIAAPLLLPLPVCSLPFTLFFIHSYCRPLGLSFAISFHYIIRIYLYLYKYTYLYICIV